MPLKKVDLESRKINIVALESLGVDCFCGKFFITNKTIANLLYTRWGDSCTDAVVIMSHIKWVYISDTRQEAIDFVREQQVRWLKKIDSIDRLKDKKKKEYLRKIKRNENKPLSSEVIEWSSKQPHLLS